jgi:hypothetical protein
MPSHRPSCLSRALLAALVVATWSAVSAEAGVAASAPGPRGSDLAGPAGAGATAAARPARSCRPRSRRHRKLPCPRLRRYPTRFSAPPIPIGRDGYVTTAAALEAFAATVGPLPGVHVRHRLYRRLPFATGPIEWVRYRWSALSKAQRRGVTRALARAHLSTRRSATAAESQKERVARLLSQAKALLATHIGGVYSLKFEDVVLLPAPSGLENADTKPAYNIASGEVDCPIKLFPRALGVTDAELVGLLAHETFHCIDLQIRGSHPKPPEWLHEGLPEWVGCVIGKEAGAANCPQAEDSWREYLLLPDLELNARTYDAIGFFAHLAETGHDVFKLAPKMLINPAIAYKLVVDDTFERSWAASYRRDAALGPDWDTTGPGMPKATYTPGKVTIKGATGDGFDLTAKRRANLLVRLRLFSQVIVVRRKAGATPGHLRDINGGELGLDGGAYCTLKSGCGCPGEPAASAPPKISQDALLGLTGGNSPPSGATMRVTGWSVENYCDVTPRPKPGLPPSTGTTNLRIEGDVTATIKVLCSGSGRTYSFFDPKQSLNLRIELQNYHGEGDYGLSGVIDTIQLFLDGNYTWPAFDAEGYGPDAAYVVKGTWHVDPGGRKGAIDSALIYSSPSSTSTNPHNGQTAHISGTWACGPA